jgi:hypothetical protein
LGARRLHLGAYPLGMLSFTAAGVVSTPTTVQIRVTRAHPGRLSAGAPAPSRDLELDEVRDNLRWFTHGRRGPRTSPCVRLVLTGALDGVDGLPQVIDEAHSFGVDRVVVHGAAPGSRLYQLADERIARAPVAGATVVLRIGDDWDITQVAGAMPARVVLTWPFPPGNAPELGAVSSSLVYAVEVLDRAGIPVGIKGVPTCLLPPPLRSPARAWRSGNRFYVDADHQRGDALMFFPDVVRWSKADACRYCPHDLICDGVAAAWLEQGVLGPLGWS